MVQNSESMLHIAAFHDQPEMLQMLMDRGCNPFLRNSVRTGLELSAGVARATNPSSRLHVCAHTVRPNSA